MASEQGVQVKDPIPAMISPTSSHSLQPIGREMTVQGVFVPPKPTPPGEEGAQVKVNRRLTLDCCMSGCVHCVYTVYADDLEQHTEALKSARQALTAAQVPLSEWPEEIRDKAGREDGVKVAAEKQVEQTVDPTMAAFLA
jgi:hypothetical protein